MLGALFNSNCVICMLCVSVIMPLYHKCDVKDNKTVLKIRSLPWGFGVINMTDCLFFCLPFVKSCSLLVLRKKRFERP